MRLSVSHEFKQAKADLLGQALAAEVLVLLA